jgi:hypothetical protein
MLQSIKAVSVTLLFLSMALVSVIFVGEDIDVEQQLKQLQALSQDKIIQSEVKTQTIDVLIKTT